MANKNENTIYTYRYIWKTKDAKKDMFNVKYITDVEKMHNTFMKALQDSDNVLCATRIYISEVNVSLTEQHEIVKKEKK